MLFFSRNKWFAVLILLVSFFNPYSGLAGLVSTIIALLSAYTMGFSIEQVKSGLYSYSSLLLGLGMGTFYDPSTAFWILLALAAFVSVLLSAAAIALLAKDSLPALSLGFIFSFWIVILAANEFSAIGLTQRNIYWLNEMYATGGNKLIYYFQLIENWTLPDYFSGFFKSMSAIIFQSNILAGVLLSAGVLFHSRIAFSLMVLGYAVAMLFNNFMGGFPIGGVNYYNMGTNFMLVAVAIGGFYLIPSIYSYLWAIITVPVSYLLVVALGKITYTWGLPVFSLPFCMVVILFLYCLTLRRKKGRLVLTPIQYYSPEDNLYKYINNRDRLMNLYYHQLFLPFLGEWMVSQGYNGRVTHKADWNSALDFVILDSEMKSYKLPGNLPEHFYCYNKPVLSPADGIVEEILDHIDDNVVGSSNIHQNWGNSIVIRHAEGLYTKLSHLKKQSFKVEKGAWVKKGDIIASCGNSGRSPEPHLHFQVQSTPYIGSKTKRYPFSYFKSAISGVQKLETFTVPKEGSFVSNIVISDELKQAFNFQPGYLLTVSADEYMTEEWEVAISMNNVAYLYCRQHDAYAYFVNNGTVFYFTDYIGPKNTLLYLFYLAAFKVLLSIEKQVNIEDNYPLSFYNGIILKWLQDLISPFVIFMKIKYRSTVESQDSFSADNITLSSMQTQYLFQNQKDKMNAEIKIKNARLSSFTIHYNNKTIEAKCTT